MLRIVRHLLIGTVAVCAAPSALHAGAELKHIFLIEAADCVSLPDLRVQTGFRLQGMDGLITALHGVVGCNHITARQPESGRSYTGLSVRLVDVERDVAVLSVPGLGAGAGLKPHPTGIPSERRVVVIGHPSAMPGLWDMPLEASERSLRMLSNVLPPQLFSAARKRGSPSVGVRVLALNGDLQPGHSGAPVLDNTRRVLGVASGGLGDGTLGIGWAIPINEIQWRMKNERDRDLKALASEEPTAVFAHRDPDQPVRQPVVRSKGSACIQQTYLFDLDRGDSHPARQEADLFLNARTTVERYLQSNPWGGSGIAVIGARDFERVTLAALRRAEYGHQSVNASRDSQNALPPGTVLAIRTSEGRYAKLRIISSQGDAVHFDWVTFALPSEGPSPLAAALEPCGAEGGLLCGTGKLSDDQILSFRVVDQKANELIVALRHRHNQAHGQAWIGAHVLDKDGTRLNPGFYPKAASSTGETFLRVPLGRGGSRYLLFWMYESNKSEAFVCRRFDYRR